MFNSTKNRFQYYFTHSKSLIGTLFQNSFLNVGACYTNKKTLGAASQFVEEKKLNKAFFTQNCQQSISGAQSFNKLLTFDTVPSL